MQFIETSNLKPGMRLAKPIYGKTGVMLYDRDTKLTDKGIKNIENFELIGIYILEPAEPVPPLTQEDLDFEQFQTVSVFQMRDIMDALREGKDPKVLNRLVQNIIRNYGTLDHKINFTQSLRSTSDYVYKHALNVGILTAMLSCQLKASYPEQIRFVTAALLYDIGYLYLEDKQTLFTNSNLNSNEKQLLMQMRKKGYEDLNTNPKSKDIFPEGCLELLNQIVSFTSIDEKKASSVKWLPGAQMIRTADTYDRMTAMNVQGAPTSEFLTIQHLLRHEAQYGLTNIRALIESIQILPAGCCVDLRNGEKALVITENESDFAHPVVLLFSNNFVYDLASSRTPAEFQIKDVMKTMDNRIHVDNNSLQRFRSSPEASKKVVAKSLSALRMPQTSGTATSKAAAKTAATVSGTKAPAATAAPTATPVAATADSASAPSTDAPVEAPKPKKPRKKLK